MRRALALSFACLLALPALAEQQAPLVVVLDPGHGGRWPHDGAHGGRGLHEKMIALQVARKTKESLEAQGATVILTRDADEDIPLADRVRIANEAGADVFLSIHCNSMETVGDRKVTRGVETYFLSPDPTDAEAKMLAQLENGGPEAVPLPRSSDAVTGILNDLALGQARNDSAALAQIVQQHIVRGTRATSRGVRQAPFLVLSGTRMPSVLVEIGFISHPREGRMLSRDRYQRRVAQALADGVRDFADKVLSRRLVAQVKTPPENAQSPQVKSAGVVASPVGTR
ncbi:MAG TPA: N-acetylmuramoyl-L-alanine amidase [Myxococcales bacterium]